MNKLIKLISYSLHKGHKRSVKAKKHILYSLFLKGLSIAINFAMVPILLGYLDSERYGIWLTLSSIIGFASFFDLGLGNGLRNLYTKAIADNDHKLAKTYVSTTYGTLIVLMSVVVIIFHLINPYLNWQKILNTSLVGIDELAFLASIVVSFFCLRFIFNLISFILLANQRPAVNNIFSPLSNLLSLGIVLVLTYTTEGSLLNLAFVLSTIPVLILILANVYFFTIDYKAHKPSFQFYDKSKINNLLGLGFKFFILQIGALVLISTDNIIVTQLFGPDQVVVYQVARKYMGTSMMVYMILLAPIWSACTEAYHNRDFEWIKNTIHKYEKIALVFIIITFVMVLISSFVYNIWLGGKIAVPFLLTLSWGLNSSLLFYGGLYTHFLNGIGKVQLSLITSIFTISLNIPLSILFGKNCGFGLTGVVLATNVSAIIGTSTRFIQFNKIINNKAKGIWLN